MVRVKNSKAAEVKTDRAADIEIKIEPQSAKLVGYDKINTRDHYRGLEDVEKQSSPSPSLVSPVDLNRNQPPNAHSRTPTGLAGAEVVKYMIMDEM